MLVDMGEIYYEFDFWGFEVRNGVLKDFGRRYVEDKGFRKDY